MSDLKPIVPGTDLDEEDRAELEDRDAAWAEAVTVDHNPDDELALHPSLVCTDPAHLKDSTIIAFGANFCTVCGRLVAP